jgi:hypothetical protein
MFTASCITETLYTSTSPLLVALRVVGGLHYTSDNSRISEHDWAVYKDSDALISRPAARAHTRALMWSPFASRSRSHWHRPASMAKLQQTGGSYQGHEAYSVQSRRRKTRSNSTNPHYGSILLVQYRLQGRAVRQCTRHPPGAASGPGSLAHHGQQSAVRTSAY